MKEEHEHKQKHHGHHGGKVMDVTRPGKAQPSASSRPLIMNNKPTVQDDTLTTSPGTIDVQKEVDQLAEPAAEEMNEVTEEMNQVADSPASPDVQPPPADSPDPTLPAPEEEPTPPEAAQTPPSVEETLVADPSPEPVEPSEAHLPTQQQDVAGEPTPEIENELMPQTVDTTQMVVSMHRPGRSLVRVVVFILVLLIVLAVGFDLLLDFGNSTSSIPHTHLFGQ